MRRITVISFYTYGYEREMDRLDASLDRFGIENYVQRLDSKGSWVRNCAMKPNYIYRCLRDFPDDYGPILWLDADAEVKRPLDFLDDISPGADIGLYRRPNGELLSGTIWLGRTPATEQFVDYWSDQQRKQPDQWDQRTLADAIRSYQGPLNIHPLPQTACYIFDCPKWGDPVIADPCIVHHQASRRLKGAAL